MDTNKILRAHGYATHPRFKEIAKFAAKNTWHSEEELIKSIDIFFNKLAPKEKLLDEPKPSALFLPTDLVTESKAIDQLKLALRLPVAIRGAGMPDIHPGYSLPIGGVVALDNAVAPAFVGYDIGCQVNLSIHSNMQCYNLSKQHILDAILKSTSFGLNSKTDNIDHAVMYNPLWKDIPFLKQNYALARQQLGSSGGGNHFADWVHIPYYNGYGLMTHSGSRGIGNKAGHFYAALAEKETALHFSIAKDYGWLNLDTDIGKEYWAVMNLLVEYASACHAIIHKRFSEILHIQAIESIRSIHNTAVKTNDMIIHRKGAIEAFKDQIGLIPGSSGDRSFIVIGMGNEESLWSASHGAGRPRSRTASKASFDKDAFEKRMKESGILYSGVAPDEGFEAYKPIDSVIAAESELVQVIAPMYPMVVVMGGTSDDGD